MERIASASKAKRITSFVANVNLISVDSLPCRAIYANANATLNLTMAGATTDSTTTAVFILPAGTLLPVQATSILTSGTTATDVVVLW